MIFQFSPQERSEFHPGDTFGDNIEVHNTLTAEACEERMSVVLEAWGWTEEKRDEETEYGELVNEEAWRTDTELAYFIAVNSPSDTPTAVFAAILEARGWPRDPYGIN